VSDTGAIPAGDPQESWAVQYVASCSEVLNAANACVEVANLAVGARSKADERPQHEISIKTFSDMAERKEQEFVPLYRAFAEACTKARDTAASFLAAQPDAEMVLMLVADEATLDNVATVKAILRANYTPTPSGFMVGVEGANALIQAPFPEGGNIYAPLPPAERTCPWCAETIKAAAVICRYCGRDVQVQPNTD
jgi:hypothetical protein